MAACHAMATRFELVLHGPDDVRLRAAADQALHEIERLHAQLSLYSPSSEISYINARAHHQPVQVEPGLFQLLKLAQQIHAQTDGAFDITIAPLLRCWGFMGNSGAYPSPEQLAQARAQIGMQHVILDEQRRSVRFERPDMMIDLGSIGKGYALDLAGETLREAGIKDALLHGGTSTVLAMGRPPDQNAWKIAIDAPPKPNAPSDTPKPPPVAVVHLKDETLSVSGVHGKSFSTGGHTYGHVIDPRTGMPAQGASIAAVALPSGAESDAFSTALLLGGLGKHAQLAALRPGMRTLVAELSPAGELQTASKGIEILRDNRSGDVSSSNAASSAEAKIPK
jgi:FAD:protein FMN transferase